MIAKVKKYLVYVQKFINSPIRGILYQELMAEVKERGTVQGVQSFLHKRSEYFFPGYDKHSAYGPVLSIKKIDPVYKIVLPISSEPVVSIVVPMYNQVEHTYYCVRSIYEYNKNPNYEVIIADDRSPDGNEFLKQHIDNLIIVRNETNLGFLKNCNNAAKKARGKYIVFLNNDTVTRKEWLVELLQTFENYKDAGLVGSKLIYPNGKLQEAGGIVWKDGSAWNYGNQDHADKPEYNYVKEVDYISGASIMIKTSLWKEIGGFDEHFSPAYCEDSDLCFEVRKRGYKVYYQPFSIVVHFEGASHGTDTGSGIKKYQVINNEKLKEKWKHELALKSPNGENVFTERDRSGGKKHVLIVDHNLPTPDQDAGSRTMSNYVDSLLSLGCNVKFLSSNPHPAKQYKRALQEKGVEVFYCVEGNPFNFNWERYFKDNFDKYDIILLSRSSVCIPFMVHLRNNNYKGTVIYYGHDLGYLRLEQESIIAKDISLSLKSKLLKAEEDFMYEYADHSLAISFEEMEFLKRKISQPIHYIPPYFFDVAEQGPSFDERDGIMFIGGFNHTPNQDAIAWFLEEVYQPLYDLKIKLSIAGSNVPDFVYNYKKKFPTLEIFSNISSENLNNLYSRVRLSVVPLRVGAGVKGKVIEAMSKGVPVAGTHIAFEGLPRDGGFLYNGANTAKELQYAILQAYSDKNNWERFSRFGKDYVLKYFNRESMKSTFKKIVDMHSATDLPYLKNIENNYELTNEREPERDNTLIAEPDQQVNVVESGDDSKKKEHSDNSETSIIKEDTMATKTEQETMQQGYERISCLYCHSADAEQVRDVADIVRCGSCGLVYLRTRPTKETMYQIYQAYANDTSHMRLPSSDAEIMASPLRRHEFINEALQHCSKRSGLWLDVGCGWGGLLSNVREKGFSPIGIEMTRNCLDFATMRLQIPVSNSQFTDSSIGAGSCQVMSMVHVLEHIPNPQETLAKIYDTLVSGGYFFGIVPNIGSYCSEKQGEGWVWLDPTHHYVHYTPSTLRDKLEHAGFVIEKLYTSVGDYHEYFYDVLKAEYPSEKVERLNEIRAELERNGKGDEIRFFVRKP